MNIVKKAAAGVLMAASLAAGSVSAEAMPVQALHADASATASPIEHVWCCRYGWRGYGWRGYGWRGYGWRRPFVGYGYGYGWRRPYRWGYHVGIRGPRVGSYAR